MWNNKRHVSLLLLFVLIGLVSFGTVGTEKAYACSCLPFANYTVALQESSQVLDATVVNKNVQKKGDIEVVLSVAAKWKGEAEHSMTVITAADSAACGYEFEIGKRYAVFTNEYEGKLQVSLCSATTPIADDSPIFDELGSPEELPFTRDDNGIITTAKVDSSTSDEPYHPDTIKESVTADELEQKLADQKSTLIVLFAIVGGLLIVGAGALLLIRNRR